MDLNKINIDGKYPARNILLKALNNTAEKTTRIKNALLRVAGVYTKEEINNLLQPIQYGQLANRKTYRTWALLNADPGADATDSAEVVYPLDGVRTEHTDPVVGGTVPDDGLYIWSVSPAGWRRVAETYSNLMTEARFNEMFTEDFAWISAFDILDDAGNLLISIDTNQINHPDINSIRAAVADSPAWADYDAWVSGFLIEDEDGNRLFEFTADQIIHPWATDIASRVEVVESSIVTMQAEIDILDPSGIAALIARVTAAENLVKRISRSATAIALLGDSRLDQWNATTNRISSWCFINWLNALLGHPWEVVNDHAVSGQRSDQYLSSANVDDAIASNAMFFFIFGIVNDVAQGGAQDYFELNFRSQLNKIIANGGRPVLCTEPGAQTMTNATLRGTINLFNQKVRRFCSENGQAILVDLAASTLDPASVYMMRTGYCYDNTSPADHDTHFTTKAALGQALDAYPTFQRLEIPKVDFLVGNIGDSFANGGIQYGDNPLLLSSGGSLGGVASGVVAANALLTTSGSIVSAVGSLVSNPNGYGQRQKIVATASGAGYVSFNMDMTAIDNPGEQFRASCYFELDAGNTGLQAPQLRLMSGRNGGAPLQASDLESDPLHLSMVDLGGRPLTLRTPKLTIPVGTRDYFSRQIMLPFSGAGTITAYISRPGCHKEV